MARIIWTLQAVDDVNAICAFIGHDAPRYAQVFAGRLFSAVERLADFPLSARIVPEIGREDVREIIYGNYRIIYLTQSSEVKILTVFHCARMLKLPRALQ